MDNNIIKLFGAAVVAFGMGWGAATQYQTDQKQDEVADVRHECELRVATMVHQQIRDLISRSDGASRRRDSDLEESLKVVQDYIGTLEDRHHDAED